MSHRKKGAVIMRKNVVFRRPEGGEKKTPAPNEKKCEERDKSNKEPIPNTKEGSMKK